MIESLSLTNFKCFANVEVPIGALTILSGLNGTGKSSVLQSLLLLRQSRPMSTPQTSLLLRRSRSSTAFTKGMPFRLTLNGPLTRLGTASDVLYEGAEDDRIRIRLKLHDKLEITWSFRYTNPDENILSGEVEPNTTRYLTEPLFRTGTFHYLQAERIGPRTFLPASDSDVIRRMDLGSRGENTVYFLATFGEKEIPLKALAHPRAASLTLRDQVEAWIGEISPGTRIHITPYKDIDLVSLRYSFVEQGHVSNPHRSTNVGFGLTYILPIVVALLYSSPGKSIVLLENPEAHLHPRGQSRLGELLAKAAAAGVQTIAETHSDHLLNGIRIGVRKGLIDPSNVAVHFLQLEKEGERISSHLKSPKIDNEGRLDFWPEGFFDEWDKNLGLLLHD